MELQRSELFTLTSSPAHHEILYISLWESRGHQAAPRFNACFDITFLDQPQR